MVMVQIKERNTFGNEPLRAGKDLLVNGETSEHVQLDG